MKKKQKFYLDGQCPHCKEIVKGVADELDERLHGEKVMEIYCPKCGKGMTLKIKKV